MSILKVENLSKNYGRIQALKNVSFSVPEGTVFGILGPNGSGKTTTLGTITDVLRPTSGSYKLFNEVPTASHRSRIGTLLETPNFYHYLSGKKNLEIAAEIKQRGQNDIDHVLQLVDLARRKDSKFSTYSLGMKQRLAIASALLGNPNVLIFDEPTNGLDPVGIAEIRELMKDLHRQGKTIIMASHLLDEVEKVCTHVAILKNEKLFDLVNKMSGVTRAVNEKSIIRLFFPVDTSEMSEINNYCFNNGIVLNHLILKKKSLEARFFELTNNN